MVKNKWLLIIVLCNFFTLAGAMGRNAMRMYYYIYALKRPDLISLFMTVPNVAGIFTLMIAKRVSKKVDKKKILQFSQLSGIICNIGIFLTPFNNIPLALTFIILSGALSVGSPSVQAMVADAVDYGEDKFGVRIDGTAYALMGFGNKMGGAIAPAIALAILGHVGYVARQDQTPRALMGINIGANLLPTIFSIAAFLLILFAWKFSDREADEVRARLREKKAMVQQA
jgi:GPH family glycoside/pentoside/hexuronide:cation symporter/probable glucitol transport protein GutA